MCSNVFKRRSCHFFSALHPGDCVILPCTRWYIEHPFTYPWGVKKGTSCNRLYIGRPLVYGYALDNTTTNLISHVPWVYWETPLGYLIHLRKSLWPSCSEPYTKNNIQGDYYTRTLEVYHEWHLVDNPGERPDYLNPSCHFKFACLTYSLSREIFCVFSSFSYHRLDRSCTN